MGLFKKLSLVVPVLVISLSTVPCRGDCGAIPFTRTRVVYRKVKLFEPNQNAVIAWNGKEQILILSTDLRASSPTEVLEVLPLPSKPVVTKADMRIFDDTIELINKKLPPVPVVVGAGGGMFGSMGGAGGDGGSSKTVYVPPAGKLAFSKKIGATDISVVQVVRPSGFIEWVEKYLKKQNAHEPKIPEPLKEVVTEYMKQGYYWFAFNVVSVGTTTVTKSALQYRFRSNAVYYPLKITRVEEGDTKVKLLVYTNNLLPSRSFTGINFSRIRIPHKPFTITSKELQKVDSHIYSFLGCPRKSKLRIWEISGTLSGFKEDLIAGILPKFTMTYTKRKKTYGPYLFTEGSQVNIGGRTYILVDNYPKTTFFLQSANKRFGPFEYRDQVIPLYGLDYEFRIHETPHTTPKTEAELKTAVTSR